MKHINPHKIVSAAFIEKTPAGSLALAATEAGLARLFFCNRKDYDAFINANQLPVDEKPNEIVKEALHQVTEYFDGKSVEFNLLLDLEGQPPFRTKALRACAGIPFGKMLTYGELAAKAGSPKAARAAGGAMAHNPIALIIPCHRVVGSDKGLHGFSSPGELKTKAILLRHEGVTIEHECVV
ncbi:MAG: methylated-DNA--[protein]-cysteine S-methyltransferase [Anaerolineaceae bacterium]|nr:methylated-DNA--[protein]-cysteine S-methyltransferase [Anaerolineaceae bacterium]